MSHPLRGVMEATVQGFPGSGVFVYLATLAWPSCLLSVFLPTAPGNLPTGGGGMGSPPFSAHFPTRNWKLCPGAIHALVTASAKWAQPLSVMAMERVETYTKSSMRYA